MEYNKTSDGTIHQAFFIIKVSLPVRY